LNGQLLKYIKGTQYVGKQILEKMTIKQSLPYIAATVMKTGSEQDQLYHQMTTTKQASDRQTLLKEHYRALGSIVKTKHLDNSNHHKVLKTITNSKNLGTFSRLVVGLSTFHSVQHTQAKKRNSYTVSYKWHDEQHRGEILYFVTNFQAVFAVVAPFVGLQQSVFPTDDISGCTIPHITVYTARSETTVHIVDALSLKLCVSMRFEEHPSFIFVAQQPNTVEKD